MSPLAPVWRGVRAIAGAALFLYAWRVLAPLPIDRGPFVLLAAMLAAGAAALADALAGLACAALGRLLKRAGS